MKMLFIAAAIAASVSPSSAFAQNDGLTNDPIHFCPQWLRTAESRELQDQARYQNELRLLMNSPAASPDYSRPAYHSASALDTAYDMYLRDKQTTHSCRLYMLAVAPPTRSFGH